MQASRAAAKQHRSWVREHFGSTDISPISCLIHSCPEHITFPPENPEALGAWLNTWFFPYATSTKLRQTTDTTSKDKKQFQVDKTRFDQQ